MAKKEVPYEEKKFLMEFLDLWHEYDRPPIHLYTDNLQSHDRGSGSIKGLQHQFVAEVVDLADQLGINVKLECLGINGICGNTPRSVMEADGDDDEEEETDEPDTVTDYGDEDEDEDEATDYGAGDEDEPAEGEDETGTDDTATDADTEGEPDAQDAGGGETTGGDEEPNAGEDPTEVEGGTEGTGEDDTATDYGAEDETGDEATDVEGGEDTEGGDDETATDYGDEAGGMEGEETGEDTTDDTSEDTASDEQSDSSNTNILIKNFSLMRDFEKLYALITDNTNTLNSTLKADPGQNRVLVQVSRNLNSIKDFILTFIQFHFKNDNYQYNLYYYEVVVQLLKLNLTMLEKALTLGDSKKDNKKEVNKNG